jgi:hypothetical protein
MAAAVAQHALQVTEPHVGGPEKWKRVTPGVFRNRILQHLVHEAAQHHVPDDQDAHIIGTRRHLARLSLVGAAASASHPLLMIK